MKHALLYIHGKDGSAAETDSFANCCDGYDLIGVDCDIYLPWETPQLIRAAFTEAAAQYPAVSILANSIGAYFAMLGLFDCPVQKALFISPVLDMEKLIQTMMGWAGVTEDQLREQGEIATSFGQTLSWKYLCWVREHPAYHWTCPVRILYGSGDPMTDRQTVEQDVRQHDAALTVMEGGEHWFHTPQQLAVLREWEERES